MDLWEYQPKKNGRNPDAVPPAENGEPEELSGVVENIVYHSDESGYTVCAVKIPGREDAVTVVGNCAAIWIGESLKASGRWVRHRQHGLQFQTDSILCVAPTSARGLERYLASGMIRGIGKVMAARLVEHFGQDPRDARPALCERRSQSPPETPDSRRNCPAHRLLPNWARGQR